jgi:DNA-binding protein H-NS
VKSQQNSVYKNCSEKHELEKRLAYLKRGTVANMEGAELSLASGDGRPRRNYPRVRPKYRNNSAPHDTWSGRGKQPRWLVAAIKAGRKIDHFKIAAEGRYQGRRQGCVPQLLALSCTPLQTGSYD